MPVPFPPRRVLLATRAAPGSLVLRTVMAPPNPLYPSRPWVRRIVLFSTRFRGSSKEDCMLMPQDLLSFTSFHRTVAEDLNPGGDAHRPAVPRSRVPPERVRRPRSQFANVRTAELPPT